MQFDVQSVIRRIEIRLAEIGMTKQEFYEKSGISSGSFSQWNTGKHAPSIKKVQRAASVIGVTTEYLLYGVDPMPDFAVKSPIVARINALLAAKGIPKQQFYKDCGITSASYSLWNTGKTNPSMKNLKIIAEYLGVSVADLLPDDDPSAGIKKDPIQKDEAVSPAAQEILDFLDSASGEELADVIKYIRYLKSQRGQA
jgi:transcriptional regulator with XRE-family HTH domain